MAKPTRYTPELLAKAEEYINTWESLGDPVPMLCGLAVHCGIVKETVSRWRKEEGKEAFNQLCARVEAEQERVLLQKGLTRQHDNSLTKLMLMRHGYSDRIEQDVKSSDGSMSPTKIEIVAPDAES